MGKNINNRQSFSFARKIIPGVVGFALLNLHLATDDHSSGGSGMSIKIALYLSILIFMIGGISLLMQAFNCLLEKN